MTNYVIDVHDLSKSFGERRVVADLTLQVTQGEVCGFLGANGSGKTTTIRMLCGLLKPDAGTGTCLGLDVLRDATAIRRQIGYMTQRFSYYGDLTVTENLELVAGIYEMSHGRSAVRDIIERMQLQDYAHELAAHLSGGWQQRLALAACMLHRPKLLLLDEPTAGVDAKARREFWDRIRDLAVEGLTVLVSTHYMDEAERCDRIVYLAGGRIVVEGDALDVARRSGLITYDGSGENLDQIARHMRELPGVETAAVFRRSLHVAGTDRVKLERAIADVSQLTWREVEPRLEDVFIHELTTEEEVR
jgi:ABC-2 type transport system ATP-binding protein